MASKIKIKFKKKHFQNLTRRRSPESSASKARHHKPSHRVRVDWHQYFMNIAAEVASRSTCDRKHVGAVIVRDKTILSTGYNGSVRGLPHCDDVGHMMEDNHCVATIHAEANAIIQAAKNGVRVDGADIYITASPCWNCFKIVTNAGIKNIYYGEFYRDDRIFDAAKRLGMFVRQIMVHKTR
jgi:dCMP deaminase